MDRVSIPSVGLEARSCPRLATLALAAALGLWTNDICLAADAVSAFQGTWIGTISGSGPCPLKLTIKDADSDSNHPATLDFDCGPGNFNGEETLRVHADGQQVGATLTAEGRGWKWSSRAFGLSSPMFRHRLILIVTRDAKDGDARPIEMSGTLWKLMDNGGRGSFDARFTRQ